jgi:hypothetical protein
VHLHCVCNWPQKEERDTRHENATVLPHVIKLIQLLESMWILP